MIELRKHVESCLDDDELPELTFSSRQANATMDHDDTVFIQSSGREQSQEEKTHANETSNDILNGINYDINEQVL